MSMSYEIERDVLACALAEAQRQVEEARESRWNAPNPDGVVAQAYLAAAKQRHETWKARFARIQTAIYNLDAIFADEQRQIVEQWSPP